MHDSQSLEPLVRGIPPIRSRRRPGPEGPIGELGAIVGVAARDGERERAAQGVASEMNPVVRPPRERPRPGLRRPLFPAPAACWWARTMVESTDSYASTSPAASARVRGDRSIRSKVPFLAQRRKRACSVAQDPNLSGTSRQAVPVRNFQTLPSRTVRSSSRFLPRSDRGNRERTNFHSKYDSSRRQSIPP